MVLEEEDFEEEPTTKQAPAPAARQSIAPDPGAFADALLDRMQARQAQQAPEVDELAEMTNYLRANGFNQEAVDAAALAASAVERKLARKYSQNKQTENLETARSRASADGMNYLGKEIRRLVKDNPALKDFKDSIHDEVVRRLKDDSNFQRALFNGSLDEDLLDATLEQAAGKFSNLLNGKTPERQPQSKTLVGTSGGKDAAKSDKAAAAKGEKFVPDVDALRHDQRQAYYDFVETNQRFRGMSKEEAEKNAFEFARTIPKIEERGRRPS